MPFWPLIALITCRIFMFSQIAAVVTPIFLITAIGYAWARRGQPFDNATVSGLVMYVGTPALVFHSLTSLRPDLAELRQVGLATAGVIAFCLLLGYLGLRAVKLSRNAFLPSLFQANAGNMGVPLVMLTFGDAGLALGVVVFFVHALSQNSLGLAVSSGSFSPQTLLRQPIVWSVLLACLVLVTDTPVPVWLSNTTDLLGGLLIPAMLLMLGTSLVRLSVNDLPQALWLALARLALGMSAALSMIWLFDLQGVAAGVLFLQASMPVAVFNFVFADRFNRNPEQVAATVLVSTLLAMAMLPLLVAGSIYLSEV